MSPQLIRAWKLIDRTWDRFTEYGDLLAAAISFYTLLSLAPLGVIALSITGVVFGRDEARAALLHGMQGFVSPDIVELIVRQLDAAEASSGKVAAVMALVVLMGAASRLFVQLQDALNLIWSVPPIESTGTIAAITRYVFKRLLSFAMVMGTGLLLVGLLVLQTLLSAVGSAAERVVPEALVTSATGLTEQVLLPLALLTVSCAITYRIVPDVRVRWGDVWVGAALTSVLILIGTWLLGLYLTRIAPGWLQGAVGTIAVFMVWTYYLAQVFLLGAAFTREWSGRNDARADAPVEKHATPRV